MSRKLVEVDILETSEFLGSGVVIYHTSMGLGLKMAKELDPKLTLEWLRGEQLSFPMISHHVEEVSFSNLGQTKSRPLAESGCFLSN